MRARYLAWALTVIATAGAIGFLTASGQPARRPADAAATSATDQWPAYGGDPGGTRYSRLTQITPDNVASLDVAWTYRTGELGAGAASADKLTFEATPIHFDGRLYLSTAYGRVIALDPASGREVWTFDARLDRTRTYSEVTSRGVSAWRDAAAPAGEACATRIFVGTIDARLIAIDARSGARCAGFGSAGTVTLTRGVYAPSRGDYQMTSPPAILRDLVVVGSSVGDNWQVDTGSGVVRAFDARSGALRWQWQPLARQDERAGQAGAANAWAPLAVDSARDLVLVPTSSPSPDFFGGLRPGANADANSLVALRGATGERVWAFQTVHHDLWDFDLAAQPALVTVTHGGRRVDAVAQATKMGAIFLLDRLTGRPLFPVEERAVVPSDVAGERASDTQPFPTRPRLLVPTGAVTADTVWGRSEQDRAECRQLAAQYRSAGIYTPPSRQGTIMYPGNASGVNWGSVAIDPTRARLVTNTSRLATLVQLVPRDEFEAARARSRVAGESDEYGAQRGAPFGVRRRTFATAKGIPCVAPPWGTLVAVDLNTGEVAWEVPLGTLDVAGVQAAADAARDAPAGSAIGLPNAGGPIITASGLIFIGAAMDGRLRAFDLVSGTQRWEAKLPRAGIATPMTYETASGRQMVVIAAGGHGKAGLPTGDYVIAFALPSS